MYKGWIVGAHQVESSHYLFHVMIVKHIHKALVNFLCWDVCFTSSMIQSMPGKFMSPTNSMLCCLCHSFSALRHQTQLYFVDQHEVGSSNIQWCLDVS